MGELAKLLSGMTEWDREAVTARYNALFDADPNEEEVSARLGSPTMAAVKELRGYVPTPDPTEAAPETASAEETPDTETTPGTETPDADIPVTETPDADIPVTDIPDAETRRGELCIPDSPEAPETPAPEIAPAPELMTPEDFPDIEALLDSAADTPAPLPADEAAPARRGELCSPAATPPETAPASPAPERAPEYVELREIDLAAEEAPESAAPGESADKLRPGRVIAYLLFGIVLCVPAAVALTVLALAIAALGVGMGAAGIFAVTLAFHGITVFADVMLLCGAGVAVAALGVPIAFFAFWFFTRCVVGFVDGVLRGGKKWCRETPEKEDEDE